jgi:sec-independent protein translocase protein TatC
MSAAQEESFISHLVELRDRLLRSLIAVAVVLGVLCIYPGPGEIYDILAAPLTKPAGRHQDGRHRRHHAVHGAAQGHGHGRLCAGAAVHPLSGLGLHRAGLYAHEKRLGIPLIISSTLLFMLGMSFCYFFVFGRYSVHQPALPRRASRRHRISRPTCRS